jgi:hypothetical protein
MGSRIWITFSLLLAGLCMGGCLSGWALEDSPTDADLFGVYGVPGGQIFAVGAGGVVLVRESGSWRELDSGTEENLRAVWGTGPEHVVVVGDACTALEFNGEPEPPAEGEEPPPDLRALEVEGCPDFRSLDGCDATDANAVGSGRIYWYGGQQFNQGGTHAENLLGVHCVASNDRHMTGDEGIYKHYDGEAWARHQVSICPVVLIDGECPLEPMLPILWDVWAGSAGEGVVVGNFGGLWALPPPAEGPWLALDTEVDADLRAVAGWEVSGKDHASESFTVGDNGIVLLMRGEKVSRQDLGVNENLYGVWASDDGKEIFVVGEAGTIAHLSR